MNIANEPITADVDESVLSQDENSLFQRPSELEWKDTPTAQKIMLALRFAQGKESISLVYGGAGLGKTCTARRYQEEGMNVWFATMSPAINSVAACLERVALAVGLMEAESSSSKTEGAITNWIKGSGGLLIIDEAQHLEVKELESIRGVYDVAKVGVAIMGNESLYAKITGGRRQNKLAQLFSRIGFRLHLPMISVGDVEAIITAWGITNKDVKKLCVKIASQAGALRDLINSIDLAFTMLDKGETVPTTRHIRAAHEMRGGTI